MSSSSWSYSNTFLALAFRILYFPTFYRSGLLVDEFQDFFKNSGLCTNPSTTPLPDQNKDETAGLLS